MKTSKDGAAPAAIEHTFQRRGDPGAYRRAIAGAVFDRPRAKSPNSRSRRLVERHGAMVLRVCRPQLTDPHDTQDAFQATFLILVKKARASGFGIRSAHGSIRWPFGRRRAPIECCPAAETRTACGRDGGEYRSRPERRAAPNLSECFMKRSTDCPSATAFRSCFATSRLIRARRQRGGWAARSERSRAGACEGAAIARPADPARPGSVGRARGHASRRTAPPLVIDEIVRDASRCLSRLDDGRGGPAVGAHAGQRSAEDHDHRQVTDGGCRVLCGGVSDGRFRGSRAGRRG